MAASPALNQQLNAAYVGLAQVMEDNQIALDSVNYTYQGIGSPADTQALGEQGNSVADAAGGTDWKAAWGDVLEARALLEQAYQVFYTSNATDPQWYQLQQQADQLETAPVIDQAFQLIADDESSPTWAPPPAQRTPQPISPFFPNLKASPDAKPAFVAQLKSSLELIVREASSGGNGQLTNLLNGLKAVPITVYEMTGSAANDTTQNTAPGAPTEIYWSSSGTPKFLTGGYSNLPAANLLHELTHAYRFYKGYENRQGFDEIAPVWAQNWLIWRVLGKRGVQRTDYTGESGPIKLPQKDVIWPAAASYHGYNVRAVSK